MRISEHTYAVKIPFQVQVNPELILKRFAYVYFVLGKDVNMIDAGIAGCEEDIWAFLKETGRDRGEINRIILTHAHPGHIGAVKSFKETLKCQVAASEENVAWIEDVDQQYKERPTPGFHTLVQGSVKVEWRLKDGDVIDLGNGSTLKAIYTPGHSKGHLAFFHEQDGVLISGDSIPVAGQIPIYEDVSVSLFSIERLKSLNGVKTILSSWDEPRSGDEVQQVLTDGAVQIMTMHRKVLEAKETFETSDLMKVSRKVFDTLGLPENEFIPLFFRTIKAHLETENSKDKPGDLEGKSYER
jgi:hydroxyacylglutathione hydrolase